MNPATRLYRAAILNPLSARDWRFHADGALVLRAGRVLAVGNFDVIAPQTGLDPIELDGLILPGFSDVHIHWVQHAVRGRFEARLLPWLREHIWPEETRYGDDAFARQQAAIFFDELLAAGTVMGMAYSSAHLSSTLAAFELARGDWMIGNALMPVGAPAALAEASARAPEDILALFQRLGQRHYALTPRFALNCTAPQMRAFGAWAAAAEVTVQTHLAESPAELVEVAGMFPEALDYTDVYDRAGLLGPRSVLGHCIHMSSREWRCLAARGSWIAHCPTSNEALDSGRMDLAAVRAHAIPYALASDVGGGPSHSMLHVMQRYLAVHRAVGERVDEREALYRATLAGAQCMGRGREAGNLLPGKRADFVLLPRPAGRNGPAAWMHELLQGEMPDLETRPLGTWLLGERVHTGIRDGREIEHAGQI